MKKIIFVVPLVAMMVVGCSNPTNTVIIPPVVPTTEPEQPAEPQTPAVPEDKKSLRVCKA